jgi:hypothetical protein
MSTCVTPPSHAPVVSLTLAGSGEPLLRMEKRLSCAAAGLGIRLDMEIRKDADVMGLAHHQTPAVLHDGKVIFSGLHRTEDIEVWLKKLI